MTGIVAAAAVAPVFVLGHKYGFIADVSIWALLAALLASLVIGNVVKVVFPPGVSTARVFVRGLLMAFGTGAVMYLTGWGAVLSVGFVFVAVEQVRLDGSRAARPAAIATALVIAVGEGLVAYAGLPSLMPQPEGHGLALLAVVGAWTMIGVLEFAAREKEDVASSLRNSEERLRALVQHASDAIVVMQLDGSASRVACALPTSSPGSVATSSRSCSRACATPRPPPEWRSASPSSCAGR